MGKIEGKPTYNAWPVVGSPILAAEGRPRRGRTLGGSVPSQVILQDEKFVFGGVFRPPVYES